MLTKPSYGQFIKFIIVGGANTVISYITYLILLNFFNYKLAYTLCYIVGITVSYILHARFTFQKQYALKSAIVYPFVYMVQYLINLAILHIAVENFHINPQISFIIATLITVPIVFLLSFFTFKYFK
jgi:putative flippase GtrA